MKAITTTIALLFTLITLAGTNGYNEAMETALNQFKTSKSVADFQNSANSFNRISNLAKEEWLPNYYEAQCYIFMSFMDKEADAAQKDAYLDIAEARIKTILENFPKNDEAYALQSFMYTGRLVVDPMTRGREFSIKSMGAIKTALAINPKNPRALYLELSNEVGTANFFKEDTSKYCERINALVANWDEYNKVAPMHPSWGKNQVLGLANGCKTAATPTNETK
tara:strand:- start:7359 stop:8030 length:672 start_codon:yes stop_codon:yes gene_type:complete